MPADEQNAAASAQGDAEQAGSNPAVEIGPDQAGLKVASVAIGPRGRSAIINGETYREGDLITADAANLSKPGTAPPPAVEFVVRQIDKRGVELERQGKSWRLEFDHRRLAQGDEIERSETNGQQ